MSGFYFPHIGERAIFAVPLTLAVLRMGSHDGIPVPVVVRQCIDFINEEGLLFCLVGILAGIIFFSVLKQSLDFFRKTKIDFLLIYTIWFM